MLTQRRLALRILLHNLAVLVDFFEEDGDLDGKPGGASGAVSPRAPRDLDRQVSRDDLHLRKQAAAEQATQAAAEKAVTEKAAAETAAAEKTTARKAFTEKSANKAPAEKSKQAAAEKAGAGKAPADYAADEKTAAEKELHQLYLISIEKGNDELVDAYREQLNQLEAVADAIFWNDFQNSG